MGMNVTKPFSAGTVNTNYGVYPKYNVRFTSSLTSDRFETTSLNSYITEYNLQKAINTNPKINAILNEVNIPCQLNMKTLENLQNNHAKDTKNIACGIADNLPFALKNKADRAAIEKAAYLHDIGKALIPEEILNKNGKLNEVETNIMHKHSELSYELLKTSGLDKKTLNIIKNHHQNAKKTGYPFVDNTFFADINQQIVSIADKFSALTEKRAYKEPMRPKEALTVIYKDVKDGKLNPLVFNALAAYSQKSNSMTYLHA